MPGNVSTVGSGAKNSGNLAQAQKFISLLERQLKEGYRGNSQYGGGAFRENNGDNVNPYAEEIGHTNGLAWCATFVSWMLKNGGADPALLGGEGGTGSAGVEGMANLAAGAGRLMANDGSYQPKPGDMIFFGGEHIEIVHHVEGNRVFAIGGNTSDAVTGHWIDLQGGGITHFGNTFGPELPNAVPGSDVGLQQSDWYGTSSGGGSSYSDSYSGPRVSTGVGGSATSGGVLDTGVTPTNAWAAWSDGGTTMPFSLSLDVLLEHLKRLGIESADFLKANPQYADANGQPKEGATVDAGAKLTLPADALVGLSSPAGSSVEAPVSALSFPVPISG